MKMKGLILLATAILTMMIVMVSCKKKEEPTVSPAEPNATVSAVTEIEQTTCPVMDGMKINPNVFVEYNGKKVYFCCNDCKAKFEADPEKYVANLPQFKK